MCPRCHTPLAGGVCLRCRSSVTPLPMPHADDPATMLEFHMPRGLLVPWVRENDDGLYIAWSAEHVMVLASVPRPHWTIFRAIGLRWGSCHAVIRLMEDFRDLWRDDLIFELGPAQREAWGTVRESHGGTGVEFLMQTRDLILQYLLFARGVGVAFGHALQASSPHIVIHLEPVHWADGEAVASRSSTFVASGGSFQELMVASGEGQLEPSALPAAADCQDVVATPTAAAPWCKVLEYNRSPQAFRDALLHDPDLDEVRRPLHETGLSTELASRAKIFVRPDQYMLVQEAIHTQHPGLDLEARHVIVDVDSEEPVRTVIARLPTRARLTVKSTVRVSAPARALPTAPLCRRWVTRAQRMRRGTTSVDLPGPPRPLDAEMPVRHPPVLRAEPSLGMQPPATHLDDPTALYSATLPDAADAPLPPLGETEPEPPEPFEWSETPVTAPAPHIAIMVAQPVLAIDDVDDGPPAWRLWSRRALGYTPASPLEAPCAGPATPAPCLRGGHYDVMTDQQAERVALIAPLLMRSGLHHDLNPALGFSHPRAAFASFSDEAPLSPSLSSHASMEGLEIGEEEEPLSASEEGPPRDPAPGPSQPAQAPQRGV